MSEQESSSNKRLPGIPHRTLEHIVTTAGGSIEPFLVGNEKHVRLMLGDTVIEAENNTKLLILVLGRLKNELSD